MQATKTSYAQCVHICWAIAWRALIIGAPLVLFASFLIGGLSELVFGLQIARYVVYASVTIMAFLIQAACLQLVMGNRFGTARLALVEDANDPCGSN